MKITALFYWKSYAILKKCAAAGPLDMPEKSVFPAVLDAA